MSHPAASGADRHTLTSKALRSALHGAGIYAVFAALWILLSDQLMAFLVRDPDLLVRVSMFKGWAFVAVTGALLFFLYFRFALRLYLRQQDLFRAGVILRSIGAAVIATDARGRIEFMNAEAERLTAWQRSGANGQPLEKVFRIVNEESREPAENPVRQVLTQGLVVGLANHTLLIDRFDNEHPIVDSGAPITDPAGNISGVVLVFRDMSVEWAAVSALQESETKYRLLTEYAGDWVFWLNAEGRHLYDSPACRLFTGYDPADFAADADLLTSCIHPADRHLYEEHLRHNHNQVEKHLEFRVVHRDGSIRWLTHSCRPIQDDNGRFLGRRGSHHDITDRKKTEISLREQQWLLNAIIEGSNDAIFVKNRAGRYMLCNQAAAAFIGKPVSEVLGRTDLALFPEPHGSRIMAKDQRILAQGQRLSHEETLPTSDGRQSVFQVTKGPIYDTQGQITGLFGISRDITERTLSMRELRRLNRTLQALSHSNQALLHAAAPEALLSEICRIVVEDCGYAMAWIGLAEHDEGQGVRVLARAGFSEGYLESIDLTWADTANGRYPTGRAIREGHPVICRDMAGDPDCVPWGAQAQSMGFAASIALPLLTDGVPYGALTIYANESQAFPEAEVTLLGELASDLSFGLHSISLQTELVTTVEALRQNEAYLHSLLQAMPAGVGVVIDRVIQQGNTSLSAMTGYGLDELVGQSLRMVYPDEAEFERVGREKYALIAEKGLGVIETRWRRKDGSLLDVLLSSAPLDPTDHTRGFIFTALDISERRRAAEEARRLYQAVEQVSSSVVITDPQGTIQYVNPAFEAVTGYSRAEALGQNPRLLKSGRQDNAYYHNLWQTISGGHTWSGRLVNKRKDGTVYTEEAIISPIRDAGGSIINYVAVKRDISDELQLLAEQGTLRDQLQQAQKLESVGRLAGGVAHDFNNNLGVIQGYVEITLMNPKTDPSLRPYLEEIRKATEQSAALTRQLLAFARKQSITPQVLGLNDAIASMLKILRRLIGEDIQLSWKPGAELWPVLLDPAQLDQMLANLCVNARDAIGGVGSLNIETINRTIDPGYCASHPEAAPGDYVELMIADTGCGMTAEVRQHLFEPFFTTKPVGMGTGLGLATVFGIIKQNKGFINVYSEPGQGCCFKIFLPRHAEVPQENTAVAIPQPLPGGQETVLLVEDEIPMLKLSQRMLEELGYRVLASASPGEALRQARDYPASIDLLISDVVMPEMNGRQLADQILALRPGIRYFFVSGYTADIIAERGVFDNEVQFLQKPFTHIELAQKIRTVLDRTA
ncbi:MAG: hypothetical protein BWK76_12555 [Desulfobulbaceae bacterium A2]|nr:MAG: hypothetical protein BWK76_12555 [Desulfobulbaceae bacterium A2]